MYETSVTVTGNVATDPRLRVLPDGQQVTNFRVMSTERKFDRERQEWVDGDQFAANVACWRRLAEGVAVSLSKGDPVVITGRVVNRTWEADGQRRWVTELVAQSVGPDLSRCTATVTRNRKAHTAAIVESIHDGQPAYDGGVDAAA
ncbi:MAG: single-stranded DNA-binding protein [Sciscionella sp.]|nr:single-stranded DNA-binding protein [Sciscionella sp.]